MADYEKVTKAEIEHLTEKHLRHYGNMLASNHPFVNKAETQRYERIWQEIKLKGCEPGALTPTERQEVLEALADEEEP